MAMTTRSPATPAILCRCESPEDPAGAGHFEEDELSAETRSGSRTQKQGLARRTGTRCRGRVSYQPDGHTTDDQTNRG